MKKHKRLVFGVIGGFLGAFILLFLVMVRPDPFFNPDKVPQIVTSNFIDLDRVYEISKYRSGAGHDYALNGETCRSMKHYFNHGIEMDPVTHYPLRSKPTATDPNIGIYAPFDGVISSIGEEHSKLGKQVSIISLKNPFYNARLFHLDLLPGIHSLSKVKSGQKIATIGPKDGTDISVEVNGLGMGGRGVSYFEAMTDSAFEPYAKKGYERKDFVITKADRDASPLKCNGEQFDQGQSYDYAKDFVQLKPNPYETQQQHFEKR